MNNKQIINCFLLKEKQIGIKNIILFAFDKSIKLNVFFCQRNDNSKILENNLSIISPFIIFFKKIKL